MQLPNSLEFVVTYLALTRIGAIPVMALRAHRETEITHFVRASGATACMVPDVLQRFDHRAMAQAVAAQCPTLTAIFVLGEPLDGQRELRALIDEPMPPQTVAAELAGAAPRSGRSGDDAAVGRHDVAVEADPAHARRLCAQCEGLRARSPVSTSTPCCWRSCRSATTTTWRRRACSARSTTAARSCLRRRCDADAVFPLVERSTSRRSRRALPLISDWLNSPLPATLRLVVAEGDTERRRAPGAGIARRRIRDALRLRAAGDLRHGRGPDQHGAPRRCRTSCCTARACRCATTTRSRSSTTPGSELPDGEPGRTGDARALHHPRLLPRAGEEPRGVHARRFLPHGRHRAQGGRYVWTEGRKKDLINRGGEKISCEEVENLIFAHPKVNARHPGGHARPGLRREGLRLRHREGGTDAGIRRADRLPQAAAASPASSCPSGSSW